MNEQVLGDAMRRLSTHLSRRALSHAAVRAALVLGPAQRAGAAGARNTRKRKNKKLKRNAFGCVDVGKPCRGRDVNCCSGICVGKKPKQGKKDASRCVAHDVDSCVAAADICEGVSPVCGTNGVCFRTTGNASFCGEKGVCTICQKDIDCEADFGAGAACIVCPGECAATGTLCSPAAA